MLSLEGAFAPDEESLELESSVGRARYGELVGRSAAMRDVFGLLSRLESSLVNVLVEGESGTGKELVARAIHDHSPVAAGPFVALNCGALDRALARSELFGHRRGTFTGASEARTGAFEAASGGTLFLDEVGELRHDVQPLLLRALEAGAITRMGDNDEHPVKVRIVAATNRDLAGQVRAGNFRDDLYFRLAVVRIALPPLRDRPEDIALLARRFAQEIGLAELGEDVSTELCRRPWPGNARELKNAIHAYAVLGSVPEHRSEREKLLDDALVSSVNLEIPYATQKDRILKRFLHVYLKTLLTHTKGNQSLAAKISGLQRSYVNKIAHEVNLATAGSRPEDVE